MDDIFPDKLSNSGEEMGLCQIRNYLHNSVGMIRGKATRMDCLKNTNSTNVFFGIIQRYLFCIYKAHIFI